MTLTGQNMEGSEKYQTCWCTRIECFPSKHIWTWHWKIIIRRPFLETTMVLIMFVLHFPRHGPFRPCTPCRVFGQWPGKSGCLRMCEAEPGDVSTENEFYCRLCPHIPRVNQQPIIGYVISPLKMVWCALFIGDVLFMPSPLKWSLLLCWSKLWSPLIHIVWPQPLGH